MQPSAAQARFEQARFEQARFVETGGRPQYVRSVGTGAPLVFLHGFSDDGACWEPTAARYAALGWWVLAPDARGHGRTPLPTGEPFTAQRRAADVIDLLDTLGCGPAVLVGHSMGAQSAMTVAAERPDLVRGIVLEDPRLPSGPFDPADDATNHVEAWARQVHALPEAELLDLCAADNPSWSTAERLPWAPSKRALDLALFDLPHTWLGADWRDVFERVTCACLLVTGDPELGAAVGTDARDWFRSTARPIVELADAGHNVRREQPVAFAAAITGFLAAVRDVALRSDPVRA